MNVEPYANLMLEPYAEGPSRELPSISVWNPEVSPVFYGWIKNVEIKATHSAIQR